MSSTDKLTTYLLDPSTNPHTAQLLKQATTHAFLVRAGQGTLPAKSLLKWLAQDVLYTRAYVRFLGSMLMRLRLPTGIHSEGLVSQPCLEYRVFDLLVGALTNIQREMRFFEDSCASYKLHLNREAPAEATTRAYADMFGAVADKGLLQGLVVLWGTELCYLRAWRFARDQQENKLQGGQGQEKDNQDARAGRLLREQFIPNWSSDEFEEFVVKCGNIVDEFGTEESLRDLLNTQQPGGSRTGLGQNKQAESARKLLKDCEDVFNHVIWLESGFWPDV